MTEDRPVSVPCAQCSVSEYCCVCVSRDVDLLGWWPRRQQRRQRLASELLILESFGFDLAPKVEDYWYIIMWMRNRYYVLDLICVLWLSHHGLHS